MPRPKPEALLKRVQDEENKEMRGKLKIYLGAAPGVGKTFTMLEDALKRREQGLDVVIGVVETHNRKEIEAMVKDFEILPRLTMDYHGNALTEFDLDAALKRNPGLILIDEMAHTNIPDLRHAKRWQDIKEILDCGIDVYTTLNVQHIESLNDVVSQIIHTRVKETIPDSMLELADSIELVDLPPEDLLKRLHEGKVYIPKQAEIAAEHFFRKGNLTALRELALRVTAERVSEQVLLYRQGQGITHIWPTREKILVCVGSRSESGKLVRAARRMATKLQADWIAVHVDTPRITLTSEESSHAVQNLLLAEKLGAQTRIITGMDIVKEIMSFAREQNVSLIMVWKHVRPRWKDFLFGSLADELTRYSAEINLYIVTSETETREESKLDKEIQKQRIPWNIYALSLAAVVCASLFNLIFYPMLGTGALIMVYVLGIALVALSGQIGAAIMASILSVIAYNFFLTWPNLLFYPGSLRNSFTLLMMLFTTLAISYVVVRARKQVELSRHVQEDTAVLHSLSQQLAGTRGEDKLLGIAARYMGEVFGCEVLILIPDNDLLVSRVAYGTELKLSAKEQAVAQWAYELGQNAGLGTDTLPFSHALYVPLLASHGAFGVIMLKPVKNRQLFSRQQMNLLESCANQIALALEVDRLHEQTHVGSELKAGSDQTRVALIKSVSHHLRTPLVAVMAAASTLMEMGAELDKQKVHKLANEIFLELEHLSRLINNLLQMTYLEAQAVKLQVEPHSLKETIALVLKSLSKKIGKREIHVNLPEHLPEISYDNTFIQDVLTNLLENALKFTPSTSPIDIIVVVENNNRAVISVEDRGPGIVFDEVNKLFEKYYRGRMITTERGLGLGLAISYSIIKAHGGEIWAENRPGGGAIFRFTLPIHHERNS